MDANPATAPRMGFGLTLLGLLLLVGGVIFFQSDYFLLRQIDFSGRCSISNEELLERTGLNQRINIFQINLKRLEKRFLLIPQIQSVTLSRRLPNRLSVHIVERIPFCLVARNEGLLAIGVDGTVIEKRGADRPADCPILTGLRQKPLTGGVLKRFDDPLFHQGIDILQAAGVGLRAELSEVDLVRYRLFTRDSIQVELGDTIRIQEKMDGLRALLTNSDRRKIIGIDLRVPSQPVVLTEKSVANP